MPHALTQHLKADEEGLKRLMELSLRLAGVLVAAVLVFVFLYFFVASLEVPVLHPGSAVAPSIVLDARVSSPSGGIAGLYGTRRYAAGSWEAPELHI